MKKEDVLDMIGDARDTYVWDAQLVRSGQIPAAKKRLPAKRVWLIAAIVALMLLLVGCTIAYVLSLQDLKVGEYSFYIPPAYDEEGNVIPIESQEPITAFSQQGVNMDALAEWVAFTNAYDQDLTVAMEADKAMKAGQPWDIPENYHDTYGCYSQEMVDKLDEIVEKYDLKLLSTSVDCQYYESSVILDALDIQGLLDAEAEAEVEYGSGYFYPEGTFDIDMSVSLDTGRWALEENLISYRYSLKEYFDVVTGAMGEWTEYVEWNYTREDGTTFLLVLYENSARIYADLPDAFVSIYLDPVIWVDGEAVPMTQAALEQVVELFDLSVKPQPADMQQVEGLLAEARAAHEAELAAKQANHEAQYSTGYAEFVNYRLESYPRPENLSYVLFDINGDGVQELIIGGLDILSMKGGESYKYFDLSETGVLPARFRPCEGNVFEVYSDSEFFPNHQNFFYQANGDSPVFLTGVTHDTKTDTWYRNLTDGMDSEKQEITAEEAQQILDSYTRIDFDWLPLTKYGEPVTSVNYTDPYAKYIAGKLDRYENAVNYTYTLMDLNGDGIEELIARDVEVHTNGEEFILLSIHTIKDGELWNMGIDLFTHVCEGGILEESEDYVDRGSGGEYHAFYRYTEDGMEMIEKVVRDPATLYWGHVQAGQEGRTVTEEKAMAVLDAYKRIELDMKPFSEYPFE